ncbi:uncharacterized protein J7T54_004114 [Emericellopsis cladophorae]|uniref:Arabinan endo-1,5-alpha-L-arabinosidase n=1 Tax=Emericellopsis cladophorae TaxID=2686198 RepID=A0A9Q0BBM8_9HYPO|nr:uncharacterized protein J7T54_004114 [Emericellopsis cladophorae]KAI6778219.1 hypothetical protein J7T54_004114 [Emericellopsis cladophorae]
MLSLRSILTQTLLAVAAIAPFAHGQSVGPGVVSGDTFTHDPTIVKKPDGSYIMAFTADNVGLKTSTDRTAWHDVGPAFPNGAPWTTHYTKGDRNLWAPDISYHNGQYYLYYSASSFGSSVSAIFLATSPTGQPGSWTNRGLVIESNGNSNYNCIDPNLIVDAQGRWWMTFGSFWSGIKIVALDPNTGMRSDNNLRSIAARPANGGELEAPYIHRHGDYYYLWLSFDRCCNGAASTYRTMVGRSRSVTGPFVDRNGVDMMNGGGTEILRTHGNIYGPGHPAVFTDNDADVLVYHYYQPNGDAQIGLNLMRYENGWPVVY